ncbi:MAG: sortase [Clostridia bacterium]|nr:sortase [Clostridia bacterium]
MSGGAGYRRDTRGNIIRNGGRVGGSGKSGGNNRKRKSGGGAVTVLIVIAVLLLLTAGGMYAYDWYESYRAEKNSAEALAFLDEAIASGAEIDDYLGVIEIPAIEKTLPVFSSWDYGKLASAPCVYDGSLAGGDLIIIGHDYKAHFVDLPKLRYGDQITLKTVDGALYKYKVTDITEIDGSDVAGMHAGDWDLTLFTCNSTGAKRITVRCDKTLW